MNIFITSELTSEYYILNKLTFIFKEYDLTQCTILTTDRHLDKIFVNYSLLSGADVKIYSISNFLTDQALEQIVSNIDYLVLFSDMSSHLFKRLFKLCDETVIVNGERLKFKKYREFLHEQYTTVTDKVFENNLIGEVNLTELYNDIYLNKLKNVQRVPIHVVS